jgi:hypothetical protein
MHLGTEQRQGEDLLLITPLIPPTSQSAGSGFPEPILGLMHSFNVCSAPAPACTSFMRLTRETGHSINIKPA